MTHSSSWSFAALLSGLKGCLVPDGGRLIYAFGTFTLLLYGRDEGISETILLLGGVCPDGPWLRSMTLDWYLAARQLGMW
ncbi:hypothetical protein P170DRAFT_21030 [Aspergillus steynii IBT 23096]|uniref:Uncharacterized protein n=1 Tax=Aspergillus steynii IBT 23096 TaxID=1392250 RepID=A0A2I2GNY8_9EURO|nr:uncharacterized protein P170DRAFT_21030 [Aspergillus steynii IBT 23096]PLB54590.1 hypothetical protein P170DRAFT_21030 [Aspergillus steynii IBT 23096]